MTTTPKKGKYQCVVCKKVWDSSELVQDPTKLGWNWVCGDYFCGANVIKLNEKKKEELCSQCKRKMRKLDVDGKTIYQCIPCRCIWVPEKNE